MRSPRPRSPWFVVALTLVAAHSLVAPGCRKSAADKRARCERVLQTTVGVVTAVGVGVGESLSDGQADLSCLKENPTDPARCMTPEKAADFRARVAKGVEDCLGWPDELVGCFERMDFESPACDAAWRQFRGVVDATPRAEGPAPLWTATLPHDPRGFAALGGTLLYAHEQGVSGVRGGEVVWTKALEQVSGWLTPLASGCVLAAHAAGVVCLAPADGAVRWEHEPLPEEARVDAAAPTATGALVLDRDGRRHVFDAERCAEGGAGCRATDDRRRLPADPYVAALSSGGFAVSASPLLRVYDVSGAEQLSLRAKEWVSEAAARDDTLWVGYDRSLARIDLKGCPPETEGTLPGPCGEEVATFDEEVTGHPPLVLEGDRVALTTEHMVAVAGRAPWKAEIEPVSGLLRGDGVLYVVCEAAGGALELRAMAFADGRTTWRTRLPSLGTLGVLDEPVLHGDDTTLYVTLESRAVAVPKR